ncbi:PREDICTED: uncharacterized protein LOC105971104 [Erythranthe guttata]|uniref:uncharacterized protein LOC105971104 n=1 Tax=Erythranthe guttata TaxID=4155 RepID=UPI00064D9A90|nr:PREDICTED: uncharacterized protein LOC105971104 [Erythranthe guttata]|eukprot:XP_012851405.1 PREDICTED: uncharacterized protein LOC105971104 [Erythranthe guttata]
MASSSGWFHSNEFSHIKSSSFSSSSSSSEEEELLSLRMEKQSQEMINFIPGRFRMRRELFLHIQNDIEKHNRYFIRKRDGRGRLGFSSIQKITAALRILAYGASADYCDEYLKIGEATANETLREFCSSIIQLYEEQYLRSPNAHDIHRLLQEGESRGFPGMLGSLDCMHWQWKNCPTAWHGTHRGHHHKPTLILEAVASHDTWIWHSFFGMSGGNNDINVLDHSPLFDNIIHGRMPPVNYTVNSRSYTMGYYLTDGIYPKYATLIQTIAHPTTAKEKLFAAKQESVRKDVERAFGALQIKWGITQGPVRYWSKEDICNIMKTCIILHNMIIEDERGTDLEPWAPLPEENFRPLQYERDPSILAAYISARLSRIRNRRTNEDLRSDLMNHLWNIYGEEDV